MKPSIYNFFFIPVILLLSSPAFAGQAKIVDVEVTNNNDSYRFDVTLRHDDAGWDHYADGWEVLSPDGKVLGKRVLAHPHVSEQPFTRSLSGVQVPQGLSTVTIRAHDSVHGFNKEVFEVSLPGR
jgi:hypothetical protein